MRKRIFKFLLMIAPSFSQLGTVLTGKVFAASDPFPSTSVSNRMWAFWKKVYTQYSSKQGILHDSSDVSIIYEVY